MQVPKTNHQREAFCSNDRFQWRRLKSKEKAKTKRDLFLFIFSKACECLLFFLSYVHKTYFFPRVMKQYFHPQHLGSAISKAPLPITPWSSEEFWERGQDLSSGIQREQKKKIDSRLIKFVQFVSPEKYTWSEKSKRCCTSTKLIQFSMKCSGLQRKSIWFHRMLFPALNLAVNCQKPQYYNSIFHRNSYFSKTSQVWPSVLETLLRS